MSSAPFKFDAKAAAEIFPMFFPRLRVSWRHNRFELEGEFEPEAGFKYDTARRCWFTRKVATVVKLRGRPSTTVTKEAFEFIKAALANPQPRKHRAVHEHVPVAEFLVNPKKYVPPPPPTILCWVCGEPVYFYENQEPPTCLWCEQQNDKRMHPELWQPLPEEAR